MKIIYLLFLVTFATKLHAQPGTLDVTFDSDGMAVTPIGANVDIGRSIGVQTDGKIVVAGYSDNGTYRDFAIVRYNTDGSLDNSFGTGGKVITSLGSNSEATSVDLQIDGKIVVAGWTYGGPSTSDNFAIVRYNTDGSLDNTFDSDGIVTSNGTGSERAFAVAIQPDGKIVAAGYSPEPGKDFTILRYNTDGSLDNGFSQDGKASVDIGPNTGDEVNTIIIQEDGKIVLAGWSSDGVTYDVSLARFNIDGLLDISFGNNGKIITSIHSGTDGAFGVALQSDGKIVIAGRAFNGLDEDFALVRYHSNGSLDNNFGNNGIVTTSFGNYSEFAYAIAIDGSGKILAAGSSSSTNVSNPDFALARYNTDGSLDGTFGVSGKVLTDFPTNNADYGYSIQLTANRIYVAGASQNDFAVAAYNNDAVILPLTMLSFASKKIGLKVQLDWKTSNEQNVSHFIIQRADNGRDFYNIGSIRAGGDSYSFIDTQASISKINYYRIKIIDHDGKTSYSQVIRIKMDQPAALEIFPNPASNTLHLQMLNTDEHIRIYDIAGRLVKIQNLQKGSISTLIDISELLPGTYILKSGNESAPFIKQ